ncbi:MAG: ferredoxin Fer [Halococcoides sp.]
MPTPFEILGVDPGADEESIHRAYRRRVKDVHPDVGGSIEEFRLVQSAYEALLEGDRGAEPQSADRTVDTTLTTDVEFVDYEAVTDRGWSIEDGDLFEKSRAAGLNGTDYGHLTVGRDEPLLSTVEQCGRSWPYSCRGGACANCAVAVVEGELSQPVNHVLPEDAIDRGIRLSCVGRPLTDSLKLVYNVKHLPSIADLRLPPRPADRRSSD